MREYLDFYIDGAWLKPARPAQADVINPATEAVAGRISMGAAADVDRAVGAARRAFADFSSTTVDERIALLERVLAEYRRRYEDMVSAITEEMGAPIWLSRQAQAAAGEAHLALTLEALKDFSFEHRRGSTTIQRCAIGVCGLITPWNWPANQIACKVAPALAAGCTMVLKPSEIAPFSAIIWTEIMDAAGVPAGVFNLVNGDGQSVGTALAGHPDVDMISFTGSTRAGVEVAKNAATTVKRVNQELGGKSANIILDDAGFEKAVADGVASLLINSGQSCAAPSRMLVPSAKMEEAIAIAAAVADAHKVGQPEEAVQLGPVVSQAQWLKIQALIHRGIDEGATLAAGGLGKPEGCERGYFVKPTIFGHVTNDMAIARAEIFGPVLVIIGYDSTAHAIEIANDSDYGLAAYVSGKDVERVTRIASELRAGQVILNGAPLDPRAPFGGFKQSGNGREWGEYGLAEYLETRAVVG